jgi:hypothetical protein
MKLWAAVAVNETDLTWAEGSESIKLVSGISPSKNTASAFRVASRLNYQGVHCSEGVTTNYCRNLHDRHSWRAHSELTLTQ